MTFGSLFTGIGGMDLGLERAGMTVRWQVEIDDFAVRVLEHHWPGVQRFRDVRDVGAHNLERVDLIAGGFPCQDLSVAGRAAGLEGARSGLWFQYLRIVRELRPAWVLIENVAALRTRGADIILDGLEEAGYAAWPLVVGAWTLGAPHRRDRAWILAKVLDDAERARLEGHGAVAGRAEVAEPRDDGAPRAVQLTACWRRCLCCDDFWCVKHEEHAFECECPGIDEFAEHGVWPYLEPWPAWPGEPQYEWEEPRTVESPLGGAAYGLSERLAGRHRRNALKALGNSVVPQVVEAIGRAILEAA